MWNRPHSNPVAILAAAIILATAADVAAKETLRVTHVASAPTGLDDATWARVEPLVIACAGKERFAGKQASVAMKAVYTNDQVFLWFDWEDATLSVTKEAWKFDGQAWSHLGGNEDRIALLFEIDRIHNFASRVCDVTCNVLKC
jgi:hypothetical protein